MFYRVYFGFIGSEEKGVSFDSRGWGIIAVGLAMTDNLQQCTTIIEFWGHNVSVTATLHGATAGPRDLKRDRTGFHKQQEFAH